MMDGESLLISKKSLACIKEVLKDGCTHSEITSLFERNELEANPNYGVTNKATRVSAYLDHQDFSNPITVSNLLEALAEVVRMQKLPYKDDLPGITKKVMSLLETEGYVWTGETFNWSSSKAVDSSLAGVREFNLDSLNKDIDRIQTNLSSDPDDAITAAKNLIESTCKFILSSKGEGIDNNEEIGPLVKRTAKLLNLLPDQVSEESKGLDAIRKVLHGTGTTIQGLAELRNLYGDSHGKKPGHHGLAVRHARLAVGCAATLVVFLMETHKEGISSDVNKSKSAWNP